MVESEQAVSEEEDYFDDDDEDFEDVFGEYSTKSDFSKAKAAYEAVTACRSARSQEMRPGFENITITKDGMPIRTPVPDSRKVYISSVMALQLLLAPEFARRLKRGVKEGDEEEAKHKDKKTFQEHLELINKREVQLFHKFVYVEKEHVMQIDPKDGVKKIFIKPSGRKFMPRIGSKVIILNSKGFGEERLGGWDNNVNAYIDELVLLYDEKFGLFNELIDQLNYFKQAIRF